MDSLAQEVNFSRVWDLSGIDFRAQNEPTTMAVTAPHCQPQSMRASQPDTVVGKNIVRWFPDMLPCFSPLFSIFVAFMFKACVNEGMRRGQFKRRITVNDKAMPTAAGAVQQTDNH